MSAPQVDTLNEVEIEQLDDGAYMIYVVTWIIVNGEREAFNTIMHIWSDPGVPS